MLLVLEQTTRVESSQYGEGYSAQFRNCNRRDLEDLIYDLCPACHNNKKMSSVPHGAYAARKIQTNMDKHQTWDLSVSQINGYRKSSPIDKYQVNKMDLDHPLANYSSKLMKSIWGMYNRYSVHNLKSFTEGENVFVKGGAQQRNAAAAPASSSYGSIGGFKNGPLSNPTWEALRNHTL